MKILFATTEAVPFAKTGGLGDVCGSLPIELAKLGHDVSLVMPAFRSALQSGRPIERTDVGFEVPIGRKKVSGTFLRSSLPSDSGVEVPVYLVEHHDYFDRPELYTERGRDYKDNAERFIFFARAALEAIPALHLGTELVHCHDWTSALVPAYLKTTFRGVPPFDSLVSMLTIHNIAYQGSFWHWDMELTGIDWKYFNYRQMEFYGNLNFLKSGIAFADVITTVSPRYAQEIQSPPLSYGLEGILSHRRNELFGIMNGVDYGAWNPATDPHLNGHNYSVGNYSVGNYSVGNYSVGNYSNGKRACKAALQREFNLPPVEGQPLVAMVGRLADQKGFDLVADVIRQWAESSPVQWVILGTGDPRYHDLLNDLAQRHPDRVAVRIGFSNELAHRIEAGADIFLMPSRYEPCGLNQLYSLKYGAVPVVHATGGLADSITNLTDESLAAGTANGFSFDNYNSVALAQTLERACQTYFNRGVWDQLIRTGMTQDWSWHHSAQEYSRLYEQTLSRRAQLVAEEVD